MATVEIAIPQGSRLFTTKTLACCYDQFIIPPDMMPGMELYGHARERNEWYTLMARGVLAGAGAVSEIVYDDPSGLTQLYNARIEVIGPNLVVQQAQIFGGLNALYSLHRSCPNMLRVYPYLLKLGE